VGIEASERGILVGSDLQDFIRQGGSADVLVLATHRDLAGLEAQLLNAVQIGLRVVCACEQAFFPWERYPSFAEHVNTMAMRNGVAVVGTGANPGFMMDMLPLILSAPMTEWHRIVVRRVSNLAPYGESVLISMGIGLNQHEFERHRANGQVSGHVGFDESIAFLARHLGTDLRIVERESVPLIRAVATTVGASTFPAGVVIGIKESCLARSLSGQEVMLEHPQRLSTIQGEEPPYDLVSLEGSPPVRLISRSGIDGGRATAALMMNAIYAIIGGQPGLQTMATLNWLPVFEARRRLLRLTDAADRSTAGRP
jgi:4-hydroxy-tetrahydrodipicolinate reductase